MSRALPVFQINRGRREQTCAGFHNLSHLWADKGFFAPLQSAPDAGETDALPVIVLSTWYLLSGHAHRKPPAARYMLQAHPGRAALRHFLQYYMWPA